RPETARGSRATEALVTAIGVPFSVSFVSRRPGGEARRVVSPLASRVRSSSRHALAGDVARSRAVTFRRRTDTRSIVTVRGENDGAHHDERQKDCGEDLERAAGQAEHHTSTTNVQPERW